MQFINQIFGYPLGWIMWAIYHIVPIYGLALIIFTLLTKALLVPLMVKQQKSMAKQQAFQPRMTEIQNKYKNNKEKMNEEMMKLYEEEGYNPMSGCLPMLIQFPILFGLIDVIYNPLKHILRLSTDLIDQAMEIVNSLGAATAASYTREITVINAVQSNPDAFGALGADVVQKIQSLNFNFLGIDLTQVPTFVFNALLIIPILSGATSLLIGLQSMRQQKRMANGQKAPGSGMMNGMMLMMPVMSLVIAFQVPAGVGLYWIMSNVFSMGQTMWLNKKYNPKEMAEKAAAEAEARREENRRLKAEAKAKLRESMTEAERIKADAEEKAKSAKGKAKKELEAGLKDLPEVDPELLEKALSQKEKNRRKLAEARKRDAEKYGEEYVEVTDDDLN